MAQNHWKTQDMDPSLQITYKQPAIHLQSNLTDLLMQFHLHPYIQMQFCSNELSYGVQRPTL